MNRNTHFVITFILSLVLLNGCGTVSQLSTLKEHWGKEDNEWIAKQEITCKPADNGCSQLHLIQGDACYRLAKAGKDAKIHYECAVKHLETGIAQTKDWKLDGLDLNRAQTYENLCESVRNLQDLESGAAADQLTKKLVDISQDFLTDEPGNLAGIYFLNSARYTILRSCLIHPENCPSLCANLQAIESELNQARDRAEVSKYMENFHRLHADIDGGKRSVPGCR
jgi:hypothetical protein